MAETLQRLGDPQTLAFEIALDRQGKGQAWGCLRATLCGEWVWARDDESPIRWTWIELLEHLAKYWPWLILEETYPITGLSPLDPTDVWGAAHRRWQEEIDEEVIDAEDMALNRFCLRHDLAQGLNGIFVPSFFFLRMGNSFAVSSNARIGFEILPADTVVSVLSELGSCIAEGLQGSEEPRALSAVAAWNSREAKLAEKSLSILTALSEAEYRELSGEKDPIAFFGLDRSQTPQDTPILAAARMSRGLLTKSQQRQIIEYIRKVRPVATPMLDALSKAITQYLDEPTKPAIQGYYLAKRLRQNLSLEPHERIEPEQILQNWNVAVEELQIDARSIDALAVWGPQHGPVVFLNPSGRPMHENGKRSTLAHEICHLLVDRGHELPVGEVLGGNVPRYLEQRANAFAAELLAPRDFVAEAYRQEPMLKEALERIQTTHHVSAELAGWQLNNSGKVTSPDDQSTLRSLLQSAGRRHPLEA